jgi:uridine phosphorylase
MVADNDEPVFMPLDALRYAAKVRKVSLKSLMVPERMIIMYQRFAFNYVQKAYPGETAEWLYGEGLPVHILNSKDMKIGVCHCFIGAAAAAFIMEELIACGAKQFLEVGIAGGLQPSLSLGDIVVVTEAIRDEGTSHHYFPADVKVESTERLRTAVINVLKEAKAQYHVGLVWTTDGVYRETKGKLRKFRSQGVLAVDMESSALFAVAKHRNVEIASMQVISDILSEEQWHPAFRKQEVRKGTENAINYAVQALSRKNNTTKNVRLELKSPSVR